MYPCQCKNYIEIQTEPFFFLIIGGKTIPPPKNRHIHTLQRLCPFINSWSEKKGGGELGGENLALSNPIFYFLVLDFYFYFFA